MYKRSPFLLLLICAATPVLAQAVQPQVAAEQVQIDFNSSTYVGVVNSSPVQKFAQSFRLLEEGPISHIMLPLYCNNYSPIPTVHVSIQPLRNGLPNGRNLVRQEVDAFALWGYPDPTYRNVGMRMVEFTSNWTLTPGDYAFIIEVAGGACDIVYGPSGSTYADGEAFLYAPFVLAGSPPWRAWGRDLAFQVFQRPL